MKGNTDKWHLILSTKNSTKSQAGDYLIKNSNCGRLIGIKIEILNRQRLRYIRLKMAFLLPLPVISSAEISRTLGYRM